ncbi:MAG: outer membrane lipoprotein-sorting protein [Desulfobacteraceae bacterium]|nr:outer membrane lipoprotein-sorting protein [Desulfobacteraceae bacterium]
MKFKLLPIILAAAGLIAGAGWHADARAQEDKKKTPSVETIVNRANRAAYYQGEDGRADVRMRIIDSQGRERNRELTILRRDNAPPEDQADQYGEDEYTGDQRYYVYFKAPSDVRNTVFLVWKHVNVDQNDDRWLYLPDLDLVKRISASDKRTSFVGSHFFYEDISGRNTNLDEHELADVTDTYYILDNTPKNPDNVEFSRYRMWIHKDTFLPIQIEYYDARGEAYRRYTVENVSRPQDYITVTKAKMADLQSGGHTIVEYTDVEYDVGLPKNIFAERYLRKPPMEYIK